MYVTKTKLVTYFYDKAYALIKSTGPKNKTATGRMHLKPVSCTKFKKLRIKCLKLIFL